MNLNYFKNKLSLSGRESVISIDCLKPAHIGHTRQVTVAVPPHKGRPPLNPPKTVDLPMQNHKWRFGRKVKPPDRFGDAAE